MNVLYLPGGGSSRANYPYDKILRKVQRRGHKTTFCPITWRGTNIHDWVEEVRPTYRQHDPAQTILVGFSFGAMTALLLTAECPPAGLILCSLSPYFAEDLPFIPARWVRRLNPRRRAAFEKLHFSDYGTQIACPTRLVTASLETEWLQQRTRAVRDSIPGAHILIAQGVGHEPAAWPYVQTLDKTFDSLRTEVPLA